MWMKKTTRQVAKIILLINIVRPCLHTFYVFGFNRIFFDRISTQVLLSVNANLHTYSQ